MNKETRGCLRTKNIANFISRVERGLQEGGCLKPRNSLLLALSGGQDSACLLLLLLQLETKWGWDLHVAHCNHLWQPDSPYLFKQVLNLCFLLNVSSCLSIAPQAVASEQKARDWRYQWLQRMSQVCQVDALLTGHTATDRTETVFLHLTRGSGGRGALAFKWKRGFLNRYRESWNCMLPRLCFCQQPAAQPPSTGSRRFCHCEQAPLPPQTGYKPAVKTSFPHGGRRWTVAVCKQASLIGVQLTGQRWLSDLGGNCLGERGGCRRGSSLLPGRTASSSFLEDNTRCSLYREIRLRQVVSCNINSTRIKAATRSPTHVCLFLSTTKQTRAGNRKERADVFACFWLRQNKPRLRKGQSCFGVAKNKQTRVLSTIKQKANTCCCLVSEGCSNQSRPLLFVSKHERKAAVDECYPPSPSSFCLIRVCLFLATTRQTTTWTRRGIAVNLCLVCRSQKQANTRPLRSSAHPASLWLGGEPFESRMCQPVYPRRFQLFWFDMFSTWLQLFATDPDCSLNQQLFLCRPLLTASRFDLQTIGFFWKVPVFQDKTNSSLVFPRNRTRSQLMPILRSFYNRQVDKVVFNFGEISHSEQAFFESVANRVGHDRVSRRSIKLTTLSLRSLPVAMQRRVVRKVLQAHTSSNPSFAAVEAVANLAGSLAKPLHQDERLTNPCLLANTSFLVWPQNVAVSVCSDTIGLFCHF